MTPVLYDEIIIHASIPDVWQVLTQPDFIREWDGLPENYTGGALSKGKELVWNLPDGGYMKSKVTFYKPLSKLAIQTLGTDWRFTPVSKPLTYLFKLIPHGSGTRLSIRINDFSDLPNGEDFYNAAGEFAHEAKLKIKEMSESAMNELRDII